NNAPDYADQVLNPDNYRDVIGLPIPGDSIAYAISKTTAALDFNGFLLVVYRAKNTPGEPGEIPLTLVSQLLLVNGRPLEIEANGSYYDPADLMVSGDWSLPQTISTMLPFDYVPPGY